MFTPSRSPHRRFHRVGLKQFGSPSTGMFRSRAWTVHGPVAAPRSETPAKRKTPEKRRPTKTWVRSSRGGWRWSTVEEAVLFAELPLVDKHLSTEGWVIFPCFSISLWGVYGGRAFLWSWRMRSHQKTHPPSEKRL